ncbi:MAG TPA: EF-P beta-lysylation protein EpmB [bacterium]|nr:EF-P beta-lysylation protein EpmB [bacterium]
MQAALDPSSGVPPWQRALQEAVRDPAELLRLLELDASQIAELLPGARQAAQAFPLRVPRAFVARMRKGDPGDPLLRQVLPLGRELAPAPGYGADPVGDLAAMNVPGLLHKYEGRALLVVTGACAVHCRYCFRRHFPYGEANPASGQWERALDYLAAEPSLSEVILSGGDPLALPDERLASLTARLAAIPHLRRLRVHTRLPVVLPERVDDALLDWLAGTRLQPVLVLHANHAQELDDSVREALARLRGRGVTLLNQAVLLRGVNDSADAQAALSEALFEAGVLPYYLHLLDRVAGAGHFDVDEAAARSIVDALRVRLPGYLVPRLVREVAGAPSKLPL